MNPTFGRFMSASTCVVGLFCMTCSVATSESISTNAEMTTLQSEIQHFNSQSGIPLAEEGTQQRELSLETDAMNQITSVSQLSDVQPADWAFQALQSLVERYGIIAGYPNGTWRGNRAMTRYEFAAALNAALNLINELVASGEADFVTKDELITLQKLQEEFAIELATLQQSVKVLEGRQEQLEANQFSPITKLEGEAIFALSDAFGKEVGEDNHTVYQQRIRLNLETSFTGKDRLKTRIEFGNFENFEIPSNEGFLGFESDTEGNFELGDLEYRFPIGDRMTVFVEANDAGVHDFTDVINPFFAGSESGAISRFGRRNPIYRVPNANAGIGVSVKLSNTLSFDFGYLAGEANQNDPGAGLFKGDYGAISQLTFTQGARFALGLTYIHSYAGAGVGLDTDTGSLSARLNELGPLKIERPVVGNSYGIALNYKLSNFAIGGWVGYTDARIIGLGDAEIWNYALTLAFPDLGQEGNLGGIIIGMQPKLTGTSQGLRAVGQFKDPDTSLHIEGFYRHQLTDNIAITPGIIWLTAPNHNENNSDIIIGTIRTTFMF